MRAPRSILVISLRFMGDVLLTTLDEQYYTYAVRGNIFPDRYAVYPPPGRMPSLIAELRAD